MMSKEKIENTLWKLQDISYTFPDMRARWVCDAVVWYVDTGRASMDFIRALSRKNKRGLKHMIAACLAGDVSDNGIIKTVKSVLKTE